MIPLRKSEWILHTSLLKSVILTAKPMKLTILPLVIYMVHDYSFFGSTADFVIKKEHLEFLPDLVISKHQRRQVEIWP
jgi:hypothetical protein